MSNVEPWRVDQLMKAGADHAIERFADSLRSRTPDPILHQVVNGIAKGLGEVIGQCIEQHPGIPKTPLNAIQIAQELGILKPQRKAIRKGVQE
jgi:hypothetical protein